MKGCPARSDRRTVAGMRAPQDTPHRARPGRRLRAAAGFTMVEVMIALVIFSAGVLATSGLLFAALEMGARATRNDAALSLARSELGRLRAAGSQASVSLASVPNDNSAWTSHRGSDTDWVEHASGVAPTERIGNLTVLRYVSCAEPAPACADPGGGGLRRIRIVVLAPIAADDAPAGAVSLETLIDPAGVPAP